MNENRDPEVFLEAFLHPNATEEQIEALGRSLPWVIPPDLIRIEGGTPVFWLYVRNVPIKSITSDHGLDTHRDLLQAVNGIRVTRFEVASSNIELVQLVRSWNWMHHGSS